MVFDYDFPVLTKIVTLFKQREKSIIFYIMCMFYCILQVMCAFDFGFFCFKPTRALYPIKFLTFIHCAALSSVSLAFNFLVFNNTFWVSFAFVFFFIKYILTATYLVYLKQDESICSFHNDLHAIDSKLTVDPASFYVEYKLLFTSAVFMTHRLYNVLSFCLYGECIKPTFVLVIYIDAFVCTDMLIVSYSFIFYSVNCRLKKMFSILEKTDSDFASLQFMYKLYVDHIEKFKTAYDPLIIITIVYKIPEMMSTIYYSVKDMKAHNIPIYLAVNSENAMNLQALVITFAPALFAGMLSAQANRIKILLYDKALIERDLVKVREIERFIRYVEARGCRFFLCRLIPFDINLLTMTFSFCVTYLIVIFQFTHVY